MIALKTIVALPAVPVVFFLTTVCALLFFLVGVAGYPLFASDPWDTSVTERTNKFMFKEVPLWPLKSTSFILRKIFS